MTFGYDHNYIQFKIKKQNFAAVLAHTSKLQSTVLECQKTLNDKKKAIELATFWPAFHPEQREYELSSLSAAAPDPDRGDEAGVKS